ncbi:MAG TPA: hypothetical protein VHB02_01040 [Acidimicrobiales bacterium]|nr:hypothetical protein [Acidimicrobiales bacterium]
MKETKRAIVDHGWISPVFGDIVAKMESAADQEIARRLALGLPVVVDRGHGVEDLTVVSHG